jgi:hypothetical protein
MASQSKQSVRLPDSVTSDADFVNEVRVAPLADGEPDPRLDERTQGADWMSASIAQRREELFKQAADEFIVNWKLNGYTLDELRGYVNAYSK